MNIIYSMKETRAIKRDDNNDSLLKSDTVSVVTIENNKLVEKQVDFDTAVAEYVFDGLSGVSLFTDYSEYHDRYK